MPEHKQHASLLAKKILTFFFFKATCKIKWTQEVVRCLSYYATYLFFLFLFLFSYFLLRYIKFIITILHLKINKSHWTCDKYSTGSLYIGNFLE